MSYCKGHRAILQEGECSVSARQPGDRVHEEGRDQAEGGGEESVGISSRDYSQQVIKQNYFDVESRKVKLKLFLRLLTTCDKVLIEHHLEIFHSEFQNLLNADKNEDLGRMFQLVSRIPDGLGELRNLLENHIHSQVCRGFVCLKVPWLV